MMKKHRYVAASVILMTVLLTVMLPATIFRAVASYDDDERCASNLYTTNWLQWSNNAANTSLALSQIEYLFSQVYIWAYEIQVYGEVWNWEYSEDPQDVYDRVGHDCNIHSCFSTVLYIGHGWSAGFLGHSDDPNNPDNPPDLINFTEISSYADYSAAHQFVLMWVCLGGNNSPEGSPSAWNPLYWISPGSYPPYTWVGFDDASPWLCDSMGTSNPYENIFKYWLVWFYYFALGYDDWFYDVSIMEALDKASVATDFDDFGSSILGTGNYSTYWPYNCAPYYNQSGWYSGQMHVAGDPFNTYLPQGDM
jgi:hypothetical protein